MELLGLLRNRLGEKGFSICDPFRVRDYNSIITAYPLPQFDLDDNFAVIIGNTTSFWDPFIGDVIQNGTTADPIDDYCKKSIESILKEKPFDSIHYELRCDHDTPASGRYVHLQTAGHLAGNSSFDKEIFWSIHPKYGLWFSYRAILVFQLELQLEPNIITTPLMTVEEKEIIVKLTEKAKSENWRNISTRLAIRNSCSRGMEYRFTDDMLEYFYPIHRNRSQILRDAIEKKNKKGNES
eukprot:TRINITY_DN1200_c0_g1_i3.p1 TRINITY_DN1200_c0_g1~~TRINITY_DN1200_c0_g1_i3.p1  ORF type:complete len:239 (+),score=53.75 TRINITY_DN1200_c0_g1_i3:25-741(+)